MGPVPGVVAAQCFQSGQKSRPLPPHSSLALHATRFHTRKARGLDRRVRPTNDNKRAGAVRRGQRAPICAGRVSGMEISALSGPGREAGVGVLLKKAIRVGEPSLAEKGLGAQREEARPGMARALLARVDDCSCPAQTSSRNQPPFYFLGGSFFFSDC